MLRISHQIMTGNSTLSKCPVYGVHYKECIKDAESSKMLGVAVVTRKGSFMASKDIFLKKEFQVVDKAEPDFELVAKKFNEKSRNPQFKPNMIDRLKNFGEGLTILRSPQCPYTEKNVNAIVSSAKKKYNLNVNLIDLVDAYAVQNIPCAFGSFCLILDGEIISYHPISNTRFENIMKKISK